MMTNPVAIIGEGPTEQQYLISLKDVINIEVRPLFPKKTSIEELDAKIEDCICRGYTRVLCLIDMDNKKEGEELRKYLRLKHKYRAPIIDERKGVDCVVKFFETERCIEFFFLLYWGYTTKLFHHSDDIKEELHKKCGYTCCVQFFRKNPLHPYFVSKGGDLNVAIKAAEQTIKTKKEDGRSHSYSEMSDFFKELDYDIIRK